MSFGEQLKCRRKELGLSRSELAKQLGVSQSAVGNYETGVSAPKEEILLRIFDALHVEPNYLYRGSFESAGGDASPEERTLVEKYRALSPAGRQTIHTLLDALCRMQGEPARTIPLYRSPAAAGAAAPVPGLDYELLTVTGDVPPRSWPCAWRGTPWRRIFQAAPSSTSITPRSRTATWGSSASAARCSCGSIPGAKAARCGFSL